MRDVGGKRRVGSSLQLTAQGSLLFGGDGAGATRWRAWGQIARHTLLAQPAGDTALRDLKQLDQFATRQATRVGGQDALAQIG
ncbi:hypothetical protein SE17_36650 [Kouleothrix aurantiaca]|uniref:Uncharacterized protein n=1 Tax=Kouleothrix aurantiaca TaxID=186479 RepID=A0A0N8PR20_9CHLR|nr:hypothetical protein SE17_36650 [Kouleothrix aurantiaca]